MDNKRLLVIVGIEQHNYQYRQVKEKFYSSGSHKVAHKCIGGTINGAEYKKMNADSGYCKNAQ